jgi:hypothetical protein
MTKREANEIERILRISAPDGGKIIKRKEHGDWNIEIIPPGEKPIKFHTVKDFWVTSFVCAVTL